MSASELAPGRIICVGSVAGLPQLLLRDAPSAIKGQERRGMADALRA